METFVRRVSAFLAVISALAIVAMMVAIAADVFVRNFSGASLPGMIEIAETSLVIAVLFGLAWAGVQGEHVAVTLLTDRLSPRLNKIVGIFVWSLTTVFMGWLFYANLMRAISSTAMLEERFGILRWPIYPMRWIIVIGFFALLLVAIVNLMRSLRGEPAMGRASEADAAITENLQLQEASDELSALASHSTGQPGIDADEKGLQK